MKQQFKRINLREASLDLVKQCNRIIVTYQAQNLRLTLRQLYYQLVSRNIIPNVERSYKNLSTLVSDARLAGLMDWDAIEDRGRVAEEPQEFQDIAHLVRAASKVYRLPRWNGQDSYVELWVEKQALAGVLAPIARRFHIVLMVNKGYSSQSAMFESAKRIMRDSASRDTCHVLYLGDHDPSGEDMVRDIKARLMMFGVEYLTVNKVALTMDQINQYDPPPNPAKITDPRASAYIAKHGNSSWEVDALPPEVLTQLITTEIENLLDTDKMETIKRREVADVKRLTKAVAKL